MSPSDANPVKGSSSPPNATYAAVLTWEVFVTPGIPIVTADRPPGVRETYFQAMASALIYGARDAVLVDAFMTVKQANALADWVASKNKNLTTIYITHGHGDHWFGIGTLLERFPNAKAVASADAVTVMRQNASSEFLRTVWKAAFPSQIRNNLVIAEELKGNVIDLEGQELVAVELGHTDTDHTFYSDDYMLVRPDGAALSKQEVLKDLQIGGLEFKEVEIADVMVRIHGDAAILTGVSRTVTSRQAKETASHFRLVAVYVADRSGPRLVHFQSVSLAD